MSLYKTSDIMSFKTISISEDVYKQLDKFRLKNEDFSDAIKRLLEIKSGIMDLAGAWKKIPDAEPAIELIEKVVKKIHEEKSDKIDLI